MELSLNSRTALGLGHRPERASQLWFISSACSCSKPTLSRFASTFSFLFDVLLIRFLACVDPLLWNKSPHGRSHLRSPPNPRHLSRSPALRNTNNIHRSVSLITVHVAYPSACSSRVPRIPCTISINAPSKPGRSTHIPCPARHTPSATPTSQNQGRGPTPLAEDRG
jgi:hypothetical protein